MTTWQRVDTPEKWYRPDYANRQDDNRADQNAAAGGWERRAITARYEPDGTPVIRNGSVKSHKTTGGRRVYLNLVWTEGGKRHTFRVCEATERTRDKNLKKAWDIIHQHHLATPEGRATYRASRPKGHRK